jgi:DNA-binding XRE family transcriptional regulator
MSDKSAKQLEKARKRHEDQIRLAFANNVKTLRKRKEWTQQELAERLGVHRVTIVRIETGVHQPLFYEACLMADLLGVSIAEMRV